MMAPIYLIRAPTQITIISYQLRRNLINYSRMDMFQESVQSSRETASPQFIKIIESYKLLMMMKRFWCQLIKKIGTYSITLPFIQIKSLSKPLKALEMKMQQNNRIRIYGHFCFFNLIIISNYKICNNNKIRASVFKRNVIPVNIHQVAV